MEGLVKNWFKEKGAHIVKHCLMAIEKNWGTLPALTNYILKIHILDIKTFNSTHGLQEVNDQ